MKRWPDETLAGMKRWTELDRAKGLAILLVVFGHLVAREDPAGVTWYGPLRMVVYLFHMPFFFYLSGYVAVLSGATQAAPGAGLGRRARRLLLPFLGFGLAILLGKLALGRIITVDNMPAGLADGLLTLFWETGRSPATSVWYLLVLFVYLAVLPVILRVVGLAGLLALAALLFTIPIPPIAYLDRICGYFIFFTAGVAAAQATTNYLTAIDRWRWPLFTGFSACLPAAGMVRPAARHRRRARTMAAGRRPALDARPARLDARLGATRTRLAGRLCVPDLSAQHDLHRPRQSLAAPRAWLAN